MPGQWTEELLPLLPRQPGVCSLCRGWSPEGYERCVKCHFLLMEAGVDPVPVVLPLALSIKQTPLGGALRQYKDGVSAEEREAHRTHLDWLLRYGMKHLPCLTRTVGASFSLATWMPSGRHRLGVHPLEDLLRRNAELAPHLVETLVRTEIPVAARTFSRRQFVVCADVNRRHVLLVDDTWTTGASILSASRSLLDAGARSVHCLVLGRHFNPSHKEGVVYVDHARQAGFNLEFCSLCDNRDASKGLLDRAG